MWSIAVAQSGRDSTRGRQLSPSKECFIGRTYFNIWSYISIFTLLEKENIIIPQSIRTWTKCHIIVLILIFSCSILFYSMNFTNSYPVLPNHEWRSTIDVVIYHFKFVQSGPRYWIQEMRDLKLWHWGFRYTRTVWENNKLSDSKTQTMFLACQMSWT